MHVLVHVEEKVVENGDPLVTVGATLKKKTKP
jgi:hypothetical protein